MSNLVTKIEEAIDIIRPLYQVSLEGENDVSLNKTDFEKLHKLAENIFLLAYRENLDRYLPQTENLRADIISAPSYLQFETVLNLPGWWDSCGKNNPHFVLYPMFRWLDILSRVSLMSTGGDDDSGWLRQAEVAKRLLISRVKVGRLLKSGDLKDNGKSGADCLVDPASIIAYCNRTGVTYNET